MRSRLARSLQKGPVSVALCSTDTPEPRAPMHEALTPSGSHITFIISPAPSPPYPFPSFTPVPRHISHLYNCCGTRQIYFYTDLEHVPGSANTMEVIEVAGKLLGLAVADLGAESASEDEDTCWSREGSGASYEGGASEEDDGAGGKRKRMSADDRKARNRERNRLHARKTRQRKKQHVQELQLKIWGLRQERQRLLQLSTEHRTAGVLLALSCSPKQCVQGLGSPGGGAAPRSPPALKLPAPAGRDWARELAAHEEALRKITQEFESMDGSQQVGDDNGVTFDDGGGAGRGTGGSSKGSRGGKGTLADRTALRRERNRMHAKRTRNRKKLFVEACSVMIDKMVSSVSVSWQGSYYICLSLAWLGFALLCFA